MNKYFVGIVITVILVMLGATFLIQNKNRSSSVTIKDKTFEVELARTDAERIKGLAGRSALDADSGMLFIFGKSDIHSFWMKDTFIPLDIIWINDNKIVEITTLYPAGQSPLGGAASPNEKIPQYKPTQKANYVLEINAGLSQKYGFRVGDKVRIKY